MAVGQLAVLEVRLEERDGLAEDEPGMVVHARSRRAVVGQRAVALARCAVASGRRAGQALDRRRPWPLWGGSGGGHRGGTWSLRLFGGLGPPALSSSLTGTRNSREQRLSLRAPDGATTRATAHARMVSMSPRDAWRPGWALAGSW